MTDPLDIAALIEGLELKPHPEGGFYRETFRSEASVPTARGPRSASTAIHFALPARAFSAWHRVASDEVWHLYGGGPAQLHLFDGTTYRVHVLGTDASAGHSPQAVAPAGVWQATCTQDAAAWFGCTVSPGFDFADFDLATREWADAYPQHREQLLRFLR